MKIKSILIILLGISLTLFGIYMFVESSSIVNDSAIGGFVAPFLILSVIIIAFGVRLSYPPIKTMLKVKK